MRKSKESIAVYDEKTETVTSGALSLTAGTSYLSIDGTKAFTLGAPIFKKQRKRVQTTVATNTPVGALTVTGMKYADANVFSGFGTIAGNAPKALVLYSADGSTWVIESMVGVTVA